jgi:hypothetical protein
VRETRRFYFTSMPISLLNALRLRFRNPRFLTLVPLKRDSLSSFTKNYRFSAFLRSIVYRKYIYFISMPITLLARFHSLRLGNPRFSNGRYTLLRREPRERGVRKYSWGAFLHGKLPFSDPFTGQCNLVKLSFYFDSHQSTRSFPLAASWKPLGFQRSKTHCAVSQFTGEEVLLGCFPTQETAVS